MSIYIIFFKIILQMNKRSQKSNSEPSSSTEILMLLDQKTMGDSPTDLIERIYIFFFCFNNYRLNNNVFHFKNKLQRL